MPAPADLIVTNGKVITIDPAFSLAEAVAVRDGRIAAVGGAAEIAALANDATRVIDAGGKAVIPGLIDGHAHMDREGLKGVFPTLSGCASIDDVLQRIEALVADKEPGEWVVTMPIGEPPYYFNVPENLKENRFPTRWELDRVSPDNPVFIRPVWGFWRHTLPLVSVANSKALETAGEFALETQTVEFDRDPDSGDVTGIIRENAFMPIVELAVFGMMPGFTHEHRVAGLTEAMRIYSSTGTTSVLEEHGAAQELIQAYQAVHRAGKATVRANLVFSPSWTSLGDVDYGAALRSWSGWLGQGGLGDEWLRVEALFTELGLAPDNLLRAKSSPYTGWSGFNYDCGVPRERMVEFLVEAARNDIRISTISIDFLEVFEEVNKIVPIADKRWIIGHLNVVTEDQIRRLAELGVVMTTHTNRYIFKQAHLLKEELGAERENDISPLRGLREAKVPIGLATDNVPPSLFHPIWQSVSRYNMYADEAVGRDQALSREEALRCATMGGAYLTFDEDRKGSIEDGKLADLVILSDDPLTCDEDGIKDIVAETTIVGGKTVYQREDP